MLPATNVKSSLLPELGVSLKIALSLESTQEVLYVVSVFAGKVILGVTIVSLPESVTTKNIPVELPVFHASLNFKFKLQLIAEAYLSLT